MEIKEQFRVPVDPVVTYHALNDVGGIGECIAGVQEVSVIDDDRSRWKLEVRAGFMALEIALEARIVERVEGQRIGFAAEGQDVTLTGRVELSGADGGATDCDVFIDAVIGGPLGPMADIMARGPQEALVAETVRNIRARLEAMAPQTASANGATPPPQADASRSPGRPRVAIAAPQGRTFDLVLGGLLVLAGVVVGRALTRSPRTN
jgi:carbon monoxide dehydrogenase subunit G